MKKKILLIQPENIEIRKFRRKQLNNFVQLTIPYLAGYIDEKRYEITLIDEYNNRIPYDKCFDLVCITVNTPNANHCYEMARRFKKSGSVVVLGGPHVTLLPEEAEKFADVLIIGESEETWPRFLNNFYLGDYKEKYVSEGAACLKDLPMPRWDLLNRFSIFKGAVISSRGCPNHCSYCNLKQIYVDKFRTRPIDEVIREIRAIPSKFFVF
ncbi:B12-binding domain-containing radical SAM protein [Clostridium cylindrosporum]|uniref:Radical SAM domain-containing protein n=1 Tax=Clostridium cylindrosporum DSM 605 TaxID=1121307 RepID=A0A0J8D7B3_CLOCY|nr:cobalamin-dependent protein [Clostridium cylindrosporum]KMT21787.1 radical SAM domain-containing protein [Clostridium cylindrosporum DSM 605]